MVRQASWNEFIEDELKGEIIDMENPKCLNCNDCCSMGTLLTEEEYQTLKKYLKKNREFYERAIRLIRKHFAHGVIYYMCPFSTPLKRCRIYKIRPQICRDFHCTESLRGSIDKSSKERSILDLFREGFTATPSP